VALHGKDVCRACSFANTYDSRIVCGQANLDKEPDLFEIKFNFLDGADSTGDEASDDPKLLEVAFKEKTYPPLPFRVTPLSVDIKPRSIAKFEVEYDPPTAAQLSKALLVSKVDWKVCREP